jgi:hypothetical protein
LFALVFAGSLVVLAVLIPLRIILGGISPAKIRKTLKSRAAPGSQAAKAKAPRLRVTYSFPVAVACAVVLAWVFRVELNLADPKPDPETPKVQAYAR